MKILFVNPFFMQKSAMEQELLTPYPPLGLLYLAAAARQTHDVQVFDGTFTAETQAFTQHLDSFQPDVVCISSLITLRFMALELGRIAQQHNALVIYGGPDPTAEPAAYLHEGALVVRGEGEKTLLHVLEHQSADFGNIAGIAYLDGGTMRQTPRREPIDDLDQLAFPARDLIDLQPYLDLWQREHGYTSIALAASRGCPYGCDYCQESAVGPHYRRRSVANVIAEMQSIAATYAPDRFRLVDDLDGLGADYLNELGKAMQAAGITTPYEGLRGFDGDVELLMYQPIKGQCMRRNARIPTLNDHPHAPPALDAVTVQKRWGEGILPA